MDLNVFYNRAYGDTWDDQLSEEEVESIAKLMSLMTKKELNRYDEYLLDDSHECVIDEALDYALEDRIKYHFRDGLLVIDKVLS